MNVREGPPLSGPRTCKRHRYCRRCPDREREHAGGGRDGARPSRFAPGCWLKF